MSKHRVFVQRLAGTEFNSIDLYLQALLKQAKREATKMATGNILKTSLRSTMKTFSDVGLKNMVDIAEYESKFSAKVFSKYFDTPIDLVNTKQLEKAIKNTNIGVNNVKTHTHNGVSGLTVNENATKKSLVTAYKQFGNRKADELSQIIKDGNLQKLSIAEIHSNLEERVKGLHTAQARTLSTTAVNYTTNIAKLEVIAENSEVIKQEVWVTQLEDGTCGYCEDQDGKVYGEGEAPSCPAHFNCNCEVIPYV